jgi:hypothetical protein
MKKVEDYRNHAEECRIMARRSRLPGEREMLLNMALTWDTLATNRAEQIARKKRIAELLGGDDPETFPFIPIDRVNSSNDE